MTVYFVSRHDGAQHWARLMQRLGNWPHPIDRYVDHLDVQTLQKGDVVIGTLPLREIAAVRQRGAEFYNLDLQVPPELRGQELTPTQMAQCGATLTHYRITIKETLEMLPVNKKPQVAKTSPAVTVMLVSQELMPQYLGYVQAPTPHVLLAVTQSMNERSKALEALLKCAPQSPTQIKRLHLDESHGYADLLKKAEDLLNELQRDGAQAVTLNLTGGNKLMAMAFAQAGLSAQRMGEAVSLQYVDTANGVIEQIQVSRSERAPLPALVGVREAVLASGKPDAGCASASKLFQKQMQRTPLHDLLLGDTSQLIPTLNSLFMEIEALHKNKKLKAPQWLDVAACGPAECLFVLVEQQSFPNSVLWKALQGALGKTLHAQGVLAERPVARNGRLALRLAHPSEIDYLKGGWLEAHLASLIAAAQPDDWACGVQVGKEKGKNNEIDAIVTCGNRTLLVEVKTANLGRQTPDDSGEASSKGQDTLYKLDSVGHELARNFNNNWLVSARALSSADEERAEDKRIEVFAPANRNVPARRAVEKFTDKLHEWIEKSRAKAQVPPGHAFAQIAVSEDWSRKESRTCQAAAQSKKATAQSKKSAAKPNRPAAQPKEKAPTRGGMNDANLAKLASLKTPQTPPSGA